MEPFTEIEKPIIECVATFRAKSDKTTSVENDVTLVSFGAEENISLTMSGTNYSGDSINSSIRPINENLHSQSSDEFLNSKLKSLSQICSELKFTNVNALISAFNILNICAQDKKFNIKVSKSDENEILIYSQIGNCFNNLLIDDDGDIQYIKIGSKLGEESSAVFSSDENLNYSYIASLI